MSDEELERYNRGDDPWGSLQTAEDIALDLRELREKARAVCEAWEKDPDHVDWYLYVQIAVDDLRAALMEKEVDRAGE